MAKIVINGKECNADAGGTSSRSLSARELTYRTCVIMRRFPLMAPVGCVWLKSPAEAEKGSCPPAPWPSPKA